MPLEPADHYPGASAALDGGAHLRPFGPGDEEHAWQLDFHYPRGILPLSHVLVEATFAAAGEAAEALPVAGSRGLVGRLWGPHVYSGGIVVSSGEERTARAMRAAHELADYPHRFDQEWRRASAVLQQRYLMLGSFDPVALSPAAIGAHLDAAVGFFRDAFRVHFDVMYPLLALEAGFRLTCQALGVTETQQAALLAGDRTAVKEVDLALWELARQAREANLTRCFEPPADEIAAELATNPAGRRWTEAFEDFLARHGDRADGVIDVSAASWSEDPTNALRAIRAWVLGEAASPLKAEQSSRAHRAETEASVMAELAPAQRRGFTVALQAARAANFTWWNEEHNIHIDLRAHLPLRVAARALARLHGRPGDDALFLFFDELEGLVRGDLPWSELDELVARRREWRSAWLTRRAGLPRRLGAAQAEVEDPVMRAVIGLPSQRARGGRSATLSGLGVSPGVTQGIARLVLSADDLGRVRSGDVIVCEGSSPSWTPAFARAAACVCDSGGALTHAAIVCREYELPCVCGASLATQLISDGDLVRVDGTNGTVTVITAGATAAPSR